MSNRHRTGILGVFLYLYTGRQAKQKQGATKNVYLLSPLISFDNTERQIPATSSLHHITTALLHHSNPKNKRIFGTCMQKIPHFQSKVTFFKHNSQLLLWVVALVSGTFFIVLVLEQH